MFKGLSVTRAFESYHTLREAHILARLLCGLVWEFIF
jgi:hypothetical protein